MKYFIVFTLFLTNITYGSELKVSESEFLRKVEKGLITFEREPMIPTRDLHIANPEIGQKALDFLMQQYKARYPITFHEDFFYAAIVRTRDYQYQISYDWTTGTCHYMFKARKFEDKLLKIKEKLMIEGNTESSLTTQEKALLKKKPTADELYISTVDLKYCEKVYNRKIKKYKPKQKEINKDNFNYNKKK